MMMYRKYFQFVFLLVTVLGSSQASADQWSPWSSSSRAGEIRELYVPGGRRTTGIQVREQAGYGLVNLRLLSSGDPRQFTRWVSGNNNGSKKQLLSTPGNHVVVGIQTREQSGYGIVNIRFAYAHIDRVKRGDLKNVTWSRWSTNNKNGRTNDALFCPAGYAMGGIAVREQSGYGLVNVRIYHVRIK